MREGAAAMQIDPPPAARQNQGITDRAQKRNVNLTTLVATTANSQYPIQITGICLRVTSSSPLPLLLSLEVVSGTLGTTSYLVVRQSVSLIFNKI